MAPSFSIAGLLITTEAMVAELPKKQSPAIPGGPGGGMGGMGGMDSKASPRASFWLPSEFVEGLLATQDPGIRG